MQTATKTSVSLPASIADLVTHAGRENTRYMNPGVLVELRADAATIAVTDGHRMAILEVERVTDGVPAELVGQSIIIPLEALKALKVARKATEITLTRDGDDWSISAGSASVSFTPDDGRFPPFREVVPAAEREAASVVAFNPKYLAEAATLAGRFVDRHDPKGKLGVLVAFGEAKAPALLTARIPEIGTLRIVVMPKWIG